MVCITVPLCGFGMGGKLCQLCVCLCQTCSGFYQQKWVKSSFLPNLTITKFVDTRYHLIQKLLRQIFHCCDHIHSLLKRFLHLYGIQERTNYGDETLFGSMQSILVLTLQASDKEQSHAGVLLYFQRQRKEFIFDLCTENLSRLRCDAKSGGYCIGMVFPLYIHQFFLLVFQSFFLFSVLSPVICCFHFKFKSLNKDV